MPDPDVLLARHKPFLKYDSQEAYFADSAAGWTDNPANRLKTAGGNLIASASPAQGEQQLRLGFLAKDQYSDNAAVLNSDTVGDTTRNYRDEAAQLHGQDAYRNRVYGRVKDGADGRWLQYWFFYFYNDYNLIGHFLGAGRHEGDWEMIQIRLNDDDEPDYAVYAQHRSADARHWDQVDRIPPTQRPIVYVARGSHASYFEPGTHRTDHWFDHADGRRRSPDLTVEVIREETPEWAWILWPGYWGDTRTDGSPLSSDSPRGPCTKDQWDEPAALVEKAAQAAEAAEAADLTPRDARPALPPPPRFGVRSKGGMMHVVYDLPRGGGGNPVGLVVTVNSPEEKTTPPKTYSIDIQGAAGAADLPVPMDAGKRYDVYASTVTDAGLVSESVRRDVVG